MKKIAITGIIGSGKSTAAGLFKKLGIPVFVASSIEVDVKCTFWNFLDLNDL